VKTPIPLLDVVVHEKRFRRRTVLRDVRLALAPGEVVSIVGASGCGKSTLLRIIAGLDDRYRGSVRLNGAALSGVTREVGFIFQEPRLFPWLTVSENVAFELGRRGDFVYRHPRVAELLPEVGLAGLERALPKELSGGQAQRVAIARGLFREPRLLLLDEPFSAVDAFTRMHLQQLLVDVARRHAITVLLVTHDVDEAVLLSDRVLILGTAANERVAPIDVSLPRPRDRTDPVVGAIRHQVLDALETAFAASGFPRVPATQLASHP
jgi:sulfonate transport system ATP-binding protein